jgi:hypothetical protein
MTTKGNGILICYTYLHQLQHNLRVVNRAIPKVFPPLDRDGASRLNEPARECPFAKLCGFGCQAQHVADLLQ